MEIRTYKSYESAAVQFKKWAKKNGYGNTSVKKANKKLINLYLNHVASKNSNRTRNNAKTNLSALFSVLSKFDYIDANFMLEISNLKTKEKRDPTYSKKQVDAIIPWLEKNDPVMEMFVYFVSYLFWRPKENCRLQVKDINMEDRLITEATKTKGVKTKIIPEILIDKLKDYLKGADPEDYVFTPNGLGKWESQLGNRRNYFSKRYKKNQKGIEVGRSLYHL